LELGREIQLFVFRLFLQQSVKVFSGLAAPWPDKYALGFGFRWHKLKGRRLTAWANPYTAINEGAAWLTAT
jgi:hypothetical protein